VTDFKHFSILPAQGGFSRKLAIAAFSFASVSAVQAQESTAMRFVDALNPYVTASYLYDNNLFRLPDNLGDLGLPRPENGRSDQVARLEGGLDYRTRISQQEFLLKGFIYRNEYADYDDLDYTGGQGIGQWNWQAGRRTSGKLGFKYDKRLRNFENQLVPRKDLREEKKTYLEVDQRLAANWILNLRGSLADISFSESSALDIDRNVYGAELIFKSRAGNELGFDAEYTDGDFQQDDEKNFNEWDVGPTLRWQATNLINISGKAGWSWRDNDDPARKDYDDFTARLNFVRKAGTDGNKITAKVYRQLSNLQDEIANFALIHGVSIEPYWQATSKIGMSFLASYEDRDFKGEGLRPLPPGVELDSRDDELYLARVEADYQFNKVFKFSIALEAGERTSNRDVEEYDYRNVQASVTAAF